MFCCVNSEIMNNLSELKLQARSIKISDLSTFPNVLEPNIMGAFSVTRNRFYKPSLDALRFFSPPAAYAFPLDVKPGIENAIRKPNTKCTECLDHILNFIFDNQEKHISADVNGKSRVGADIICSRQVLEMLLCTPYHHHKDWRLHVSQFNKTIYMCEQVAAKEGAQSQQCDAQNELQASWTYKLQQLCMSKSQNQKPFTSEPVDECTEFNCVYEIVMAGIKLLYNAEMNGVLANKTQRDPIDLKKLEFVELKTQPMHMNLQQLNAFKRTENIKWWCQTYLVAINKIQVGLCDDNGLVQKIEPVDVRMMRKEAVNEWLASVCVHFLIRFLNRIKGVMNNVDNASTVYEFCYEASSDKITYKIFEGRNEHTFIPDWYRDALLK